MLLWKSVKLRLTWPASGKHRIFRCVGGNTTLSLEIVHLGTHVAGIQ